MLYYSHLQRRLNTQIFSHYLSHVYIAKHSHINNDELSVKNSKHPHVGDRWFIFDEG
jgi:hypothetical protein